MSNARAILLMVASMAFFSGVDAFVKLASATQSAGQIVAITSPGIFLVFWAVMVRHRIPLFDRRALGTALIVRNTGEVIGSVGIIIALGLAPLATVSALAQALPLAVMVGAAVFLGETIGWRRWAAVFAGLVGVLVILRPGGTGFDPNLLWILLYIFGLGARDLASRVLPPETSTSFAAAWSMIPLTIAGLLMIPFQGGWQPIDGPTALYHLGIVVCAATAIFFITEAMRAGEASAVAPFRYSRIVFALIVAMIVFGERPDVWTWLGAALIVGSGLYSFWRERHVAVPPVKA